MTALVGLVVNFPGTGTELEKNGHAASSCVPTSLTDNTNHARHALPNTNRHTTQSSRQQSLRSLPFDAGSAPNSPEVPRMGRLEKPRERSRVDNTTR